MKAFKICFDWNPNFTPDSVKECSAHPCDYWYMLHSLDWKFHKARECSEDHKAFPGAREWTWMVSYRFHRINLLRLIYVPRLKRVASLVSDLVFSTFSFFLLHSPAWEDLEDWRRGTGVHEGKGHHNPTEEQGSPPVQASGFHLYNEGICLYGSYCLLI